MRGQKKNAHTHPCTKAVEHLASAKDTELAVLQTSDYHRIVRKYPQLLERHRALVKERVCPQGPALITGFNGEPIGSRSVVTIGRDRGSEVCVCVCVRFPEKCMGCGHKGAARVETREF